MDSVAQQTIPTCMKPVQELSMLLLGVLGVVYWVRLQDTHQAAAHTQTYTTGTGILVLPTSVHRGSGY